MERYVFPNKGRAEAALAQMKQLINWYGVATRADMKDIHGTLPKPEDQRFGWIDLSDATIGPGEIGDEIVLSLPRALRIE
jgi:hypothetical protein